MFRFLHLILILLLSQAAIAQKTYKGVVMSEMGDLIKFAHIQDINNSLNAFSTNENGEFEVALQDGIYTFKVSAVNYKTEEFDIEVNSDLEDITFVITHNHNTYKEVVIYSGEDPGVRKMREVIKKRKQHADYLQSLVSDVYLKGNLKILNFPKKLMGMPITDSNLKEMGLDSMGQGIVYLLEQNTKYYYQRPNKTYNHIQSVRTSGDPQGLGFAQMPPIINIYDNNIHILEGLNPRGIISPAHSNALHYYNFKLEETFYEGSKMISKIKVSPKRQFEPLFTGYVYVVENDWIFHSLELSVDRKTGIDLLDTLTLIQNYYNYNDDQWIIKNQVIEPKLTMFGITIGGGFLTHYVHESINIPIEPKIFNTKIVSSYDSTALDKDSLYWSTNRKVPLTNLEENNFIKGDSLFNTLRMNDSVRSSKTQYDVSVMNIFTTGIRVHKKKSEISLNSLIDLVQFNNVEGLNLTLKPKYQFKFSDQNSLSLSSQLRYGFSSNKFYYNLKGDYKHVDKRNKSKFSRLSIEGGEYIADITQLMPISEMYNTYTSLSGRNFLSFYEKKYAHINWKQSLGNGFQYQISAEYQDRKPLENNTKFTWFGAQNDQIQANNPPSLPTFTAHQAVVIKGEMSYQPGWTYIQYPKELSAIKSQAPIFRAGYEKGLHDMLGSDVDYDKAYLGIQSAIGLKLIGRLHVNAEVGGFLNKNKVENPDLFHNIGNQIWLASPYLRSFQLAGYYDLSHDKNYAKVHAEWRMNGFISNKIPVIKKLNWQFIVSSNTLFHNAQNLYHETAFGIDNIGFNIYRFGRIDFIHGYNMSNKQSSYGIKIGFSGLLNNISIN